MAKQSVEFVTSGTYQRSLIYQDGIQWAAGTEDEVDGVAAAIAGDATKDTMYSWVRAKVYVFTSAAAEYNIYEWALIKCQSADALQDLNDAAAMEKLQKESRIFGRDIMARGGYVNGMKPIKFELFQVKLDLGEELRLVVRPVIASGGATIAYIGLIEWRQVGT